MSIDIAALRGLSISKKLHPLVASNLTAER